MAGELLVLTAAGFPVALSVWAAGEGLPIGVILGIMVASGLLVLGLFAWLRPLGGGICLIVFGCGVGFFAFSLIALAPDGRAALLAALPTIATVVSGAAFITAAGSEAPPPAAQRAQPTTVSEPSEDQVARRRLTGAQLIDLLAAAIIPAAFIALLVASGNYSQVFGEKGDDRAGNVYFVIGLFTFVMWRVGSMALVAAFGATLGMWFRGLRAEANGGHAGRSWMQSREGLHYALMSSQDGLHYRFATTPAARPMQ